MQNYLLNVTTDSGINTILGHSWSQTDVVQRVEFRVGMGEWKEATYEAVPEELGPLTPFNWTVAIDLSSIPAGQQTIEIRATGSSGHSLPVLVEVEGVESSASSSSFTLIIALVGLAAILTLATIIVAMKRPSVMFEGGDIFEAELIEEEDLSSLTVAELKQKLSEKGLPVSGNKSELIARLTTQTA